jgi:hypothetical protein
MGFCYWVQLQSAAAFHGTLGSAPIGDVTALQEQSKMLAAAQQTRAMLLTEGAAYKTKFDLKFLMFATGNTVRVFFLPFSLDFFVQRLSTLYDHCFLVICFVSYMFSYLFFDFSVSFFR